ncbi:MAG: hypothetical protein QXD49_02245 [Archaeoglobaceae archaeon]
MILLEKIRDFYYVITARDATDVEKRFIEGERSDLMNLPCYTDEEVEKIDEEVRRKIEKGKADFKPREETEFKNAEFVSVITSDVVYIKPHYRKVKGRRVYVRGYYRRRV